MRRRFLLIDGRGGRRERQAWAALAGLLSRRPSVSDVLVFAPGGSLHGLRLAPSVRMVQSSDVVPPMEQRSIDDRLLRDIEELLAARDLFPSVDGVHLGDLNRLELENAFRTYETLAAAIRGLSATSAAVGWDLIGHDASLLQALAAHVRSEGGTAHVWSAGMLTSWRSVASRLRPRRSPAPDEAPRGAASSLSPPPSHVLMVSWTRPMAEMFAAVEPHLSSLGGTPALRVQYGTGESGGPTTTPGVTVVSTLFPAAGDGPEVSARVVREAVAHLPPGGPRMARIDNGAFLVKQLVRLGYLYPPQAAFILHVAAVLDQTRPKLVVVGNDRWWVGQAYVHQARARGIPTLCVQDGTAGDMPQWRWMVADVLASNGTYLADLLTGSGVPEDRLVRTGQPRYDHLLERAEPGAVEAVRARLKLPSNRILVLLATQYQQDPSFVQAVFAACLGDPRVHVLLRPHPSEPSVLHHQLAAQSPDRVTLHVEEPIEDLVAACDALVVQHSTTVLEADLLGKTVICVRGTGVRHPIHVTAVNPRMADTPAEVTQHLLAISTSARGRPARIRDALAPFLGPLDGLSGRRVAETIVRLAKRAPA